MRSSFYKEMRRTTALLLFPHFAPLVGLSIVAFAYMLATPAKPTDGTGPAGSDVLGLYFIGICIILGAAIQVIVGLPLNALMSRSTRLWSRWTISFISVLLPVILLSLPMIGSSASVLDDILTVGTLAIAFSLGAWYVSSTIKMKKQNKAEMATPRKLSD